MLVKVLSIAAFALVLLAAGCGLAIHFGGDEFKAAITGHMVLGVVALVAGLAAMVGVLVAK